MSTASTRFSNKLRYRAANDPAQTHLTPEYVLVHVRNAFGGRIGLDPCTTSENPCDAEVFYAPPTDGLAQPWKTDRIFVNPPYGKAREPWVRKCIEVGEMGRRVVLLMPAATDTRVFQSAAASATVVILVRGRLKFGVLRPNRRQVAASHPSALFGWNVEFGCSDLGLSVFSHVGGGAAAL